MHETLGLILSTTNMHTQERNIIWLRESYEYTPEKTDMKMTLGNTSLWGVHLAKCLPTKAEACTVSYHQSYCSNSFWVLHC